MAELYIENADRFYDTLCWGINLVDAVRNRQGQVLSDQYQLLIEQVCDRPPG